LTLASQCGLTIDDHLGSNESITLFDDRSEKVIIDENDQRGCKRTIGEVSVCCQQSNGPRVEVQLLRKQTLIDVNLVFEGVPIWLLALKPSSIRHLYIRGYENRSALIAWLNNQDPPGLIIDRLLNRFDKTRLYFYTEKIGLPAMVLTLVSGSLHCFGCVFSVKCQSDWSFRSPLPWKVAQRTTKWIVASR
jgi:hypothetical protein